MKKICIRTVHITTYFMRQPANISATKTDVFDSEQWLEKDDVAVKPRALVPKHLPGVLRHSMRSWENDK